MLKPSGSSSVIGGDGEAKKAFQYEDGQFICHIYASLRSHVNKQTIDDVVQFILEEQSTGNSKQALDRWKPLDVTQEQLHVTLIRGHRAVYYHQIRPLVAAIKAQCDLIKPVMVCLDNMRIFHNHEMTKQFLCLATREAHMCQQPQLTDLLEMKQKLLRVVDTFALRLTGEDESEDTLAHCSLMSRQVQQVQSCEHEQPDDHLRAIERLLLDKLDEKPICVEKVDRISMKIGNHVYSFDLIG